METGLLTPISIFYYPEQNLFKDCDGRTILCLCRLIPIWRIHLFKEYKKKMTKS